MTTAIDTTKIFKDNLFNGKVVLCSGGGSGICRGMTEALVRHGAKAVIFSRRYYLNCNFNFEMLTENIGLAKTNWKRQQKK